MGKLPEEFQVAAEVAEMGAEVSASELHGLLTGWLAAGGALSADWPAQLLVDPDLPKPAEDSELHKLAQTTAQQLKDSEFGFQLLLPDDDDDATDIELRSARLLEWCSGFIGGFGLGGAKADSLSEDAQEALQDLVAIARSDLEADAESDEDALIEIEEFVKVAALLLHGEVAMARDYRRQFN